MWQLLTPKSHRCTTRDPTPKYPSLCRKGVMRFHRERDSSACIRDVYNIAAHLRGIGVQLAFGRNSKEGNCSRNAEKGFAQSKGQRLGRKSGGNAGGISSRRVASAKASLPRVYLLKELAALLLLSFLQHTTRYTGRTRYKSTYVLSERGRFVGRRSEQRSTLFFPVPRPSRFKPPFSLPHPSPPPPPPPTICLRSMNHGRPVAHPTTETSRSYVQLERNEIPALA